MMHYPIHLWPKDTLSQITINGKPIPDMIVGQKITLNNKDDLLDFLNRAVQTEIEIENYPFLFGLFGGSVEKSRLTVWVLPEFLPTLVP